MAVCGEILARRLTQEGLPLSCRSIILDLPQKVNHKGTKILKNRLQVGQRGKEAEAPLGTRRKGGTRCIPYKWNDIRGQVPLQLGEGFGQLDEEKPAGFVGQQKMGRRCQAKKWNPRDRLACRKTAAAPGEDEIFINRLKINCL